MFEGHRLIGIGEILVEFVSHVKNCGLTQIGPFSGPYPSGAPAIFADQAARVGAAVTMIGGVGADGFGHTTIARLKQDGVDCSAIKLGGRSTGTAFVSYYDDGMRDFIFHISGTAADDFSLPALPEGPLLLHVSAASLGNPVLRNLIMTCARQVLDHGGKIACDPNARPELMRDDDARHALQEIMQEAHCLLPSTSDLPYLFPDLPLEQAIERLAQRDGLTVLKRGADGATIFADTRIDLPGYAVTELDPTGAGDCFCGTFLAELSLGTPILEAGTRANAAGAIAVTRRGPMEGNSSPEEITEFLAQQSRFLEGAKA
ncbi:sugar kinase [Rhodobacteraceae bacterium]|nr:sugar kinase [Paracoccaceae bacterium]